MKHSLLAICLFISISPLMAQDNYEIQVYASPTLDKHTTIFELHSNYTFNGEKLVKEGVRPSYHALHETLEITHGFTDSFEMGFYLFSNYTKTYGYQLVGVHIRPRVRVPLKWKWPFGASLSAEVGYQGKNYSADTWSVELRPIFDKQFNKVYFSFNPVLGIGLKGVSSDHTPAFEPAFKLAFSIPKATLGVEYYGSLGQLNQIPGWKGQEHALFFVTDLYVNPKWEFNFGPGWGLTPATDHFIFKSYIGRRIGK